MKLRETLNIVPRPVRTAAKVIVVCGALIGTLVGLVEATVGRSHGVHAVIFPALALAGLGIGSVLGSLIAAWLLGLGYVYADARRRSMPYIPWTLVAAIVPNLLGFLFYLVMRKPIAVTCMRCGMTVSPYQRFCSWCGSSQVPQTSTDAPVPETR